jgi:hypothetical protein
MSGLVHLEATTILLVLATIFNDKLLTFDDKRSLHVEKYFQNASGLITNRRIVYETAIVELLEKNHPLNS